MLRDWRGVAWRVAWWVAAIVACWLLWQSFGQSFAVPWNHARLAPAAAMARGLSIYGTSDAGPFLGWIYGPVFPLVYAGVSAWPDPVAIVGSAWLLNLSLATGAAWILARAVAPAARATGATAIGLLVILGTAVGHGSLTFVHVDVLTVAFGAGAVRLLAGAGGAADRRKVVVAALLTVLAAGTKQNAAVLPVALLVWLGMSRRPAEARLFLVASGLSALVFGGLAVIAFGAEPLWFNLWVYHQHNPTADAPLTAVAEPLWRLLMELGPIALLCYITRGGEPSSVEKALQWVAWAHLPLGVLAAAKVAGGPNSIHTLHYFWLWSVVRLARWSAGPGPAGSGPMLLTVAVLAASVQGLILSARSGVELWPRTAPLRQDYQLAVERPGKVYFPWNPLVTIVTERVNRPFDDALLCLDRCGLPANPAAVRAAIPSGALIVYGEPAQSTFALKFLLSPPVEPQ